jgi:hypothetical protein
VRLLTPRSGGRWRGANRPAIGAAIGTATLVTIFYHVLADSDQDYSTAVSDAVLSAAGFMALALLIALTEIAR